MSKRITVPAFDEPVRRAVITDCVHCGTRIINTESDNCPNCEGELDDHHRMLPHGSYILPSGEIREPGGKVARAPVRDVQKYIDEFYVNLRQRGLMYGGDLSGVESVYFTVDSFEHFINGWDSDTFHPAYQTVARRYGWVGNTPMSAKLAAKMGETREACNELVSRLDEVREEERKLREKK